jgi:hypothetical protein
MTIIRYTATKLQAIQKKGVLKPDADGYYPLVIGGLNVVNSSGEYYVLEGAKELFDSSSFLMRRIKSGNLKGELGHPKKQPGMDEEAYFARIMRVEETNVCSHFKEVWLDDKYGINNPKFNNPAMVAIMALVKPSGPQAESLKQSLENKAENVCFSIRALTENYLIRGVTHRVLRSILTWDNVTEPGINIANKWDTPSLETLESTFVTKNDLERICKLPESLSMETGDSFINEALTLFDKQKNTRQPKYSQW